MDRVQNLKCHIKPLFQELVHRVSMLLLDLGELAFVSVFALWVLSVTNLIIFENLLYV